MLIVGLRDGTCQKYDLCADGAARFREHSADPSWHSKIASLSLGSEGSRIDLPVPRNFGPVTYDAEAAFSDGSAVAERVSASAGDSYITLTRYVGRGASRFRVDVAKIGKRRWRRSHS